MAAKILGSLCGQPIQTLKSGGFAIVPNLCKDAADQVLLRDYVTLNGNVVGDVVSMGFFRSTAFIETTMSWIGSDGLGAGATLNIGDVNYPSGLKAAISLTTAGWQLITSPAAQIIAPLWQRLGYPADPGGTIELLGTLAGANPANGGLGWQFTGRHG